MTKSKLVAIGTIFSYMIRVGPGFCSPSIMTLFNSATWKRESTPPAAAQETACHSPSRVPVQRPDASDQVQQCQNGIQSDCEEVGHKVA